LISKTFSGRSKDRIKNPLHINFRIQSRVLKDRVLLATTTLNQPHWIHFRERIDCIEQIFQSFKYFWTCSLKRFDSQTVQRCVKSRVGELNRGPCDWGFPRAGRIRTVTRPVSNGT